MDKQIINSKNIMLNKIINLMIEEKNLTIEEYVTKLMNDMQFIHAYFTFSLFSITIRRMEKSLEKMKGELIK